MNWLFEPLHQYLYTLSWRDALEIVFFSTLVYAVQLWLRHDTQKPLLGYWYLYCGIWIGASWLELSTITYALLIGLPAAITMFVLVHQRTLQKNYLALRTVRPAELPPDNWLDVLMQTALITINSNKSFCAIIEHQDSLETMLTCALPLHATLKKELLMLLLDGVSVEQETGVWVTTQGIIRGINARWTTHSDATNTPTALAPWQQDALFFTSLTDALILYGNCANRTFTVVAQGTMHEHMTAHNAQRYIKQHHLSKPSLATQKGETIHGSYRSQTDHKQQSLS